MFNFSKKKNVHDTLTVTPFEAAECVWVTHASHRLIVAHLFLIKVSLCSGNVGVGVKWKKSVLVLSVLV